MRAEHFRMSTFTYLASLLLIVVYFLSPSQFPVVLHKLSLVAIAGVMGYWLDRHLFASARRAGRYETDLWMIRRAIIVGACLITVGIAL